MRPVGPVAGLLLLLLAVVCGPSWTPHSVDEVVGGPWSPAPGALLGTDSLGRDVFSRTLAGGAGLIWWSVPTGVVTTAVGTVVGLLASRSRMLDRLLTATSSLVLAVPSLVVVLSSAVLLPSPVAVAVGMLLLGSPLSARIVRAAVVPLQDAEFLRVAERRGEPPLRLAVCELLPALSGTVVADIAVRILAALQLTVSLHVLGFGPQPPVADWALMLPENMPGIQLAPWSVLAPATGMTVVAIVLTLCLDRISMALAPTPTLSAGRRRRASRRAVTSTALSAGSLDAPGGVPPGTDAVGARRGAVLSVADLRLGAPAPLLVVDLLDLDAGQMVGIRGDSGAGKTTLLEALVGATRANLDVTATRHLLLGGPLPRGARARAGLRHRSVGWCEQDAPRTLDATKCVRDVIADARSRCRDLTALVELLGLPDGVLERRCGSLSGGQAARVALARALAGNPRLLLLDEPTAGLDAASITRVSMALQEYRRRDGAAVVVSHDHAWLDRVCDQILEVRDGRLVPARPLDDARGRATTSRSLDREPLVAWRDLEVLVDQRPSIRPFDLALAPGRLVALVAPSGTGKSTLLRALGGDVLPSGLQVCCPGLLAGEGLPSTELMVQDSVAALNPGRSLLAQVARHARLAQHLDRRRAREVALEQLAALGIDGVMARRRPGQCSGGERQRAAVARALVSRAPVLLLDEPTSALDPAGRRRVLSALRHRADEGVAVVLATHDADVAARADLVLHLPLADDEAPDDR